MTEHPEQNEPERARTQRTTAAEAPPRRSPGWPPPRKLGARRGSRELLREALGARQRSPTPPPFRTRTSGCSSTPSASPAFVASAGGTSAADREARRHPRRRTQRLGEVQLRRGRSRPVHRPDRPLDSSAASYGVGWRNLHDGADPKVEVRLPSRATPAVHAHPHLARRRLHRPRGRVSGGRATAGALQQSVGAGPAPTARSCPTPISDNSSTASRRAVRLVAAILGLGRARRRGAGSRPEKELDAA